MEGHLRLHFTHDALMSAGYSPSRQTLEGTGLHPLREAHNLNADRHLMFLRDANGAAEARVDLGLDTSERPFRFRDEVWIASLPFHRARLRVWTSDPRGALPSGIWSSGTSYTTSTTFIHPDPSKFDPSRKRIEVRWDGATGSSEDAIPMLREELFAILEGRSWPPSSLMSALFRLVGLTGSREGRWVI